MKFTNPIVSAESADPWVLFKDGLYYYCRSIDGGITVTRSKRLTGIGKEQAVKVWAPEPNRMYSKELWAPEIHYLKGKWYIYFAADDGDNANHRMFVLESEEAMGPYTLKGQITDPTNRWAIDGTVLEMANGDLYFVWSGWVETTNEAQNLYIAPMSNPCTICGDRVLLSEPEYDWELKTYDEGPLVNEGPQVLMHEGMVHIVYSASHSSLKDYCLGLLTLRGDEVLNRTHWEKYRSPLFTQSETNGVHGVGHASFTMSPDGTEYWILYHGMTDKDGGWRNRSTRAQRFQWDVEGRPIFGVPLPLSASNTVPSGE